jgi:hypothetical protein
MGQKFKHSGNSKESWNHRRTLVTKNELLARDPLSGCSTSSPQGRITVMNASAPSGGRRWFFVCLNDSRDDAHANIEIEDPGTQAVDVKGLRVERPDAPRGDKHRAMRGVLLTGDKRIANGRRIRICSLSPEAEERIKQAEDRLKARARDRDIVFAESPGMLRPEAINCVGFAAQLLEAATDRPVRGLNTGTVRELATEINELLPYVTESGGEGSDTESVARARL